MKFETKIKAAAAAIILVMSTVAILPMIVNRQVTMVMDELDSAANVERLQLTLLEMLLNAETAQRGFVITGSERFLEPYYYAVNTIPSTQAALRKEMTSSVEIARAEAIEQATAAKLRTVTETINLRRDKALPRHSPSSRPVPARRRWTYYANSSATNCRSMRSAAAKSPRACAPRPTRRQMPAWSPR